MKKVTDDPIEEFIGAFHSDVHDWAEQHDRYLGHALMEKAAGYQAEDDQT